MRSFVSYRSGAFVLAAAWTLAALGLGAGGGEQTSGIWGTVKVNGKPLSSGTILFCTTPEAPLAMAVRVVNEGAYSIPTSSGLVPGVYEVRIAGLTSTAPSATGAAPPEWIPAQYNQRTTLRVEIRADGPTGFNFDLRMPEGDIPAGAVTR